MKLNPVLLLMCIGLFVSPHFLHGADLATVGQDYRVWTSSVGTTVTAKLVSLENGKVFLMKEDGTKINVPQPSHRLGAARPEP